MSFGVVHPRAKVAVQAAPDPYAAVLERYRYWTSVDAHPQQALTGLLVLVHCVRPLELRCLKMSDLRPPDELEIDARRIKLAPPVVVALDRYLAWQADSYTGPSCYLLISAAGRMRDHPISKQTLSTPTFLGTSPTSLRQAAIRCLVQSGVDGLEPAAHHVWSSLQCRSINSHSGETQIPKLFADSRANGGTAATWR